MMLLVLPLLWVVAFLGALGFKGTIANSLLDALLNATAYTGPATIYMQLHTGSPGAAGTSNVASNTTRKAIGFAAAASGSIASDTDADWTNVPAAETYSHHSLWDASSGGNFLASGTLTANAVAVGDSFKVAAGTELVSLNTAS
jgi:hypothetical protein